MVSEEVLRRCFTFMHMISSEEIAALRLHNQQLTQPTFSDPALLLQHMGALQAQHYGMVQYAAGLRLNGGTRTAVTTALDQGQLIRTHVLRPTWHLAAASTLPLLLQLSASRIWSAARRTWARRGINEALFKKCFAVFRKALKGGRSLTRTELVAALKKSGIQLEGENAIAHVLMAAELQELLCSGPDKGKKTTYALYKDRVPETALLSRAQALGQLAATYCKSRGPVTVDDFSWWSGLTLTEARKGVALAGAQLQSEQADRKTYWWGRQQPEPASIPRALLLPAFDELLIAYRDRSLWMESHMRSGVISSNGIFWPVVLLNGKVAGLWKQTEKKQQLEITVQWFKRQLRKDQDAVAAAADALTRFTGKSVDLKFSRYPGK